METPSKMLRVFFQGEGVSGIDHVEILENQTFGELKALIVARHGLDAAVVILVEDSDEAPDADSHVADHVGHGHIKVHLHRCHHVQVSVAYNGRTASRSFSPSSTISKVKHWAAEHKFGLSPADATEHVLQIAGTQERPNPGTHVGTLTTCPSCSVSFDLVPNERVNGGSQVP